MRVILIAMIFTLTACPDTPTPTGTGCADPDPISGTTQLTWDNFGHDFMFKYCTNCHSADIPHSQRNGAPIYHDFDTLIGVMNVKEHVDEQTAWGPAAHNNFMPGAGTDGRCPSTHGGPLDEACPEPTAEERTNLGQWIACEKMRPH